jgi:GNAT superfamily N-acetyltransferase
VSEYVFSIENAETNCDEMYPLYCKHYAEMQERLAGQGLDIPPFKPRLDMYFKAAREGWLVNYVVRLDGEAVGYSNIYVTNDMHNGDIIAQEDTIFILKEHRNGIGRKFSKFILADLKCRGVKRLNVLALTDLRVSKLWERMGFKHTAHAMTYTF